MKYTRGQSRLERAFAIEVESKWSESFKGTFSEAARGLRLIEHKYVVALADNPALVLEIKRRVAEHLLKLSLSHRCPVRVCREKLKANIRLGFSDSWREVHFRILYAQELLLRGSRIAGSRMLAKIDSLICGLEKRGGKYNKIEAETHRAWVRRIKSQVGEKTDLASAITVK